MTEAEHKQAERVRTTREQREALQYAIDWLDAAWDYDAERGLRDDRGGMEYENQSPVPSLRELLAVMEERSA